MNGFTNSVSPNGVSALAGSQTYLSAYEPGDAAATIRAEFNTAPNGEGTWQAMARINDPQWSPTQRADLLRDLQSDGTLTAIINSMYLPSSLAGGETVPANGRRDFFVALAKNSTAAGLVATQEAISLAGATAGAASQASRDLAIAVGTHAFDATKADFVRDVAAAASPAVLDETGLGPHQLDLNATAAATVLQRIGERNPAQFQRAMQGLVAGDGLPAVLRRVAGMGETDMGIVGVTGATSGAEALMTRVAQLGDPVLSAAVLRAATIGQPADQPGVADSLAPAAARLLLDTPSAGDMTGSQRVVDQLYNLGKTGVDVTGRLMAGLAAGGRHDIAMTLARDVFTDVGVDVGGRFRNAELAGFFEEATDIGTAAYDAWTSDARSTGFGYFTSVLEIPGGPAGSLLAAALENALNGHWDSADATASDRFVAQVKGEGEFGHNPPPNTPAYAYQAGVGQAGRANNALEN